MLPLMALLSVFPVVRAAVVDGREIDGRRFLEGPPTEGSTMLPLDALREPPAVEGF